MCFEFILDGLGSEFDVAVFSLLSIIDSISIQEAQFLLQNYELQIEKHTIDSSLLPTVSHVSLVHNVTAIIKAIIVHLVVLLWFCLPHHRLYHHRVFKTSIHSPQTYHNLFLFHHKITLLFSFLLVTLLHHIIPIIKMHKSLVLYLVAEEEVELLAEQSLYVKYAIKLVMSLCNVTIGLTLPFKETIHKGLVKVF